MFPWVYGFEWSAGYVVFLGLFFLVALVVLATLSVAVVKGVLHDRRGRTHFIRWLSEFQDLPASSRACRHAFTGELPDRVCERGFDCRECTTHAGFAWQAEPAPAPPEDDRLYHRGHTWVRPLDDGTWMIGLDEFGRRLLGRQASFELPRPGEWLTTCSAVCRASRNGAQVRILAPAEGEVVDTGGPGGDWMVRLRPKDPSGTHHLLRGAEVRRWYEHELQRLQLTNREPGVQPALADGGELLADVSAPVPVCAQMLLDD